jgi:preprotein translocase subunit SecB
MDSPLILLEYCFPVVQVVANPNINPEANIKATQYDIEVGLAKSENDEVYQVTVDIASIDDQQEGEQGVPYNIHLVALGHFKVHPEWPDPDKMVSVNGASILYSAAREFLITITSRGPWGQISLPTKSFNQLKEASNADSQ